MPVVKLRVGFSVLYYESQIAASVRKMRQPGLRVNIFSLQEGEDMPQAGIEYTCPGQTLAPVVPAVLIATERQDSGLGFQSRDRNP